MSPSFAPTEFNRNDIFFIISGSEFTAKCTR